ncbi:uncharacterized protein BDV14DRAFT_128255 [Aspergillus stella-maris]|uniref:uncharacterized protein n=1 Tax=Aspergillus stella-maris TaxID=1810926 RepID=UPI003CCCB9E3
MRLHLTISRHGLPITRILWTTSPPSLLGHNLPNASSILPAASSAVTSSRMPNALYSNGGYTIAQLLEDVNEVIPLETEPRLFEDESSGQWGLEDYVVEVGGSECLHFMELEGILRDGDEVLIRALQMSDLKARRISGRHQISADGKHLIDGVPFGKPFLKRPTSSRPAIMIPPRKKRRMALALWGTNSAYEEEDTEWASPAHIGTGKELSLLKPESVSAQAEDGFEDAYQDDYEDYHEPNEDGDGTVIRHHIDKTDDGSESDEGPSEADAGELSQELQDLKKDMDVSALSVPKAARASRGYSLRSRPSNLEPVPRKSSLSRRSTGPSEGESSRRKSVTFGKQNQAPPAAEPETNAPRAVSTSEEAENSVSSDSDSDSSDSDSSASESDDEDSSADESDSDTKVASESSSDSDSDSDSSSQSSESESESEFEEEEVPKVTTRKKPIQEYNPPGAGSERTRKSNQRTKMRRRLTKLKQLGLLDENADFDALREYDAGTGDSYMPESRAVPESRASIKKKEQEDFEAKRQQLLRSLESGGVDVTLLSEKENISPSSVKPELSQLHDDFDETQYETANEKIEATPELPKRRSLNVASTRRLLFGSLGVRTPHSKEEEDTTRKKLAGKIRESTAPKAEEIPAEQPESEPEVDWREKLILGATECVFDDIELSTPPFPFEQRWDAEAGEIIRRRSQRSKKRKRRQQLQVYDEEEAYDYEDYNADDVQLNYDDVNQTEMTIDDKDESDETTKTAVDTDSDLPDLPEDASGLPELTVSGLKSGLVFAFKQLDVSKATNWQPMISEYRVAVVSEVFDDNILNIQLTKPYRKEPKNADEDEGPFQYSGFEMPGMDDDDELDDGFREVLFDDLIEPKLLRVAPAEAAEAGDEGNASKSVN